MSKIRKLREIIIKKRTDKTFQKYLELVEEMTQGPAMTPYKKSNICEIKVSFL